MGTDACLGQSRTGINSVGCLRQLRRRFFPVGPVVLSKVTASIRTGGVIGTLSRLAADSLGGMACVGHGTSSLSSSRISATLFYKLVGCCHHLRRLMVPSERRGGWGSACPGRCAASSPDLGPGCSPELGPGYDPARHSMHRLLWEAAVGGGWSRWMAWSPGSWGSGAITVGLVFVDR
jgi:hypothetical protein